MNRVFPKVTAFTLAAILAASPLTVSAASGSSPGQNPGQISGQASGSSQSSGRSSGSHGHSSGGGSSATTSSSKATSTVITAGGAVTSTIGGSYTATVVNGTAVITPRAEVNGAFGLTSGETATAVVCDSRAGEAARKSLTDAAAALGVGMGPMFDFTAMATGTKGSRTIGTLGANITLIAGIPVSMRGEGFEYAMIRVIPGGQIDVLMDMDTNPDTITFQTNASGVYMLVAVPAGYFAVLTGAAAVTAD